MATSIRMKHPSGAETASYDGFSWTCLLFGCLVPMWRGDLKFAAISALIGVAGLWLLGLPNLVWWIAMSFNYNKWHRNELLVNGYVEADSSGIR